MFNGSKNCVSNQFSEENKKVFLNCVPPSNLVKKKVLRILILKTLFTKLI